MQLFKLFKNTFSQTANKLNALGKIEYFQHKMFLSCLNNIYLCSTAVAGRYLEERVNNNFN